ncbi:MAG TPA: M48 family metallopeptidase [Steroidobacteraceae bacterium]|nr:M48 family metallopeptidase [Steroidobacteraceae bacterium]
MSREQPQLSAPPEAEWGPTFDVGRATDAYIATIPAAEREKSDDYYEGGYWIEAWGTLITVGLCVLLLRLRFAARLRDFVAARGRGPWLQSLIVAAGFFLALSILSLPWALYTDFYREHDYGMSNHTLGGFIGEWTLMTVISVAVLGLAVSGIYRLVSRVRERWALWATAITAVFILFIFTVQPVVLDPLFNDYKPLPAGEVRDSILALAQEAKVPVDDVYWFDASKQTKRISANVSGLGGTARIALNDNLLNGTSLPEIRAVMGHEMGHYRLNHGIKLGIGFTLVLGIGYFAISRAFGRLQRRHGDRFAIRDIADPAGLPLAFAIFAVVMYLLTPFTNTMVRVAEVQADAFGLDAAQEPHGFASVAMRLSTYRKLEPGALEEAIFYDHPSGWARVERAMRWLADNPPQR